MSLPWCALPVCLSAANNNNTPNTSVCYTVKLHYSTFLLLALLLVHFPGFCVFSRVITELVGGSCHSPAAAGRLLPWLGLSSEKMTNPLFALHFWLTWPIPPWQAKIEHTRSQWERICRHQMNQCRHCVRALCACARARNKTISYIEPSNFLRRMLDENEGLWKGPVLIVRKYCIVLHFR